MVSFFIIYLFVLIQLVTGYCVYNSFNDGTAIDVEQIFHDIPTSRVFKKGYIQPGNSECCPYDNSDCNSYKDKNYVVSFIVNFHFKEDNNPDIKTGDFLVKCTGGGALSFSGIRSAHNAECTEASGSVIPAMMIPYTH